MFAYLVDLGPGAQEGSAPLKQGLLLVRGRWIEQKRKRVEAQALRMEILPETCTGGMS